MESIEQTFNGTADFGKKVTCTISRNGDLIHRVYLQVTLPAVDMDGITMGEGVSASIGAAGDGTMQFRWVNYVGHALVKNVELEIGGQRIDKQYGDWLNIWNELTQPAGHQVGYDLMVGNSAHLTGGELTKTEATTLYVPLQFWFCRNPGLALPLIALQYHEVKINLEFRQKEECYVLGDANNGTQTTNARKAVESLVAASLFVDYIYLDTDERRRFAQVSHEYLIEQLQFTGDESVTSQQNKIKLSFNHPVKELVWVVQRDAVVNANVNQWNNYTDQVDADGQSAVQDWMTAGNLGLLNTNVESGWSASAFSTSQPSGTGYGAPAGGYSADAASNTVSHAAGGRGMDHSGFAPQTAGRNPVERAKLQLNGHDRFQERMGSYFNLVQPYQHHTNVPATGINVYSFGLKPEEHQPSGTCNMSRIDNATLHLTLTPNAANGSKVRVYAVNYNVLRIMSGMGGLAYSN